ncbi:MAG: hypothetical protein IKB16_06985 [Lentisphaeria bacterium]|nr:hypothetical protein [Lentisphaeria bacterium]
MKFLFSFAAFCLCCSMFAASADWMPRPRKNSSKITVKGDVTTIRGPELQIWSKKAYSAKKDCTLRISGEFLQSVPNRRFYIGLMCLDKNGKQIQGRESVPISGSDTVLLAPVKKGDRSILVKDASKWRYMGGTYAAFHGKADYSDLPNRDTSHAPIVHIEKENNGWRITFRHGMRKEYKAGTPVRQQGGGSAYVVVVANKKFPAGWNKLETKYKLAWHPAGQLYKKNLLFPGTAAFRVVFRVEECDTTLAMKNVKITVGK